jgi:hypothetical protein
VATCRASPADAIAQVLELTQKQPDEYWYQSAVLLLHLGDIAGYRQACREMLRWSDPDLAEQTAKACALAPGAVADFGRVVALADLAVKKGQQGRWSLFTRGLVEYRAARFDSAVGWLQRAAPQPQGASLDAGAFAVLALTHHRLSHAEDARAALAKAQAILAQKMPRPEKGKPFGKDWHDWLRSQILCREAEQRLGQRAAR